MVEKIIFFSKSRPTQRTRREILLSWLDQIDQTDQQSIVDEVAQGP